MTISNDNGGFVRGNAPVVLGTASSTKTGQDVGVFQAVLRLPSQTAPNKHTVPSQHYKLVLANPDELRTTRARMMTMRAGNDSYLHIQMRPDLSRNTLYLWHDTTRTKREYNPNKPFAGEDIETE